MTRNQRRRQSLERRIFAGLLRARFISRYVRWTGNTSAVYRDVNLLMVKLTRSDGSVRYQINDVFAKVWRR